MMRIYSCPLAFRKSSSGLVSGPAWLLHDFKTHLGQRRRACRCSFSMASSCLAMSASCSHKVRTSPRPILLGHAAVDGMSESSKACCGHIVCLGCLGRINVDREGELVLLWHHQTPTSMLQRSSSISSSSCRSTTTTTSSTTTTSCATIQQQSHGAMDHNSNSSISLTTQATRFSSPGTHTHTQTHTRNTLWRSLEMHKTKECRVKQKGLATVGS